MLIRYAPKKEEGRDVKTRTQENQEEDTVGNVLESAAREDTGYTLRHLLDQVKVGIEAARERNLLTTGLRVQTLAKGEGPTDNKAEASELVNFRLKLNAEVQRAQMDGTTQINHHMITSTLSP